MTVASLVLFAAVAAAARPASYEMPLTGDAGQYLYVGQTILDGGLPYEDAANNKGPLIFVLFSLIDLVSDRSEAAVHITLLPFAAFAAFALARYVAHFAGPGAGFVAGLALALFGSTNGLLGETPNTEQYGIAPMVGAWWLATRRDRGSVAGAGALTAAAFLMNPGFVVVAPFVAWELWRGERAAERSARFAAAGAGAVAAALPFVAWLGFGGALDDMWTQFLEQNFGNIGASTPLPALAAGLPAAALEADTFFDGPSRFLFAGGFLGCLVAMTDARLRRAAVSAAAWIVVMWVRAKLAEHPFTHHYYLAVPGIAAGFALGIARVWGSSVRSRVVVAAAVLALPVANYVVDDQRDLLRHPPRERWGGPGDPLAVAYTVSEFIERSTAPGEKVLVAGGNPQVYWLTDRRAPTRFFDIFPVEESTEYREERLRTLLRAPPRAIALLPPSQDEPENRELEPEVETVRDRYRYELAYDERGARVWLLPG